LERRELLAADPIHVGVVYLETDYLESDNDVGSDSQGDRFLLSFTGGAPGTELSELRIRTDKDGDGISVGDPIFDTAPGGRGKSGSHPFRVVDLQTLGGHTATVRATVEDGGQELVLHLQDFRAGDRLEFTLDVDEVLRNSLDLEVFNDRLDVITSGQEFQDSILEAVFEAPHYEIASADAIFLNDYGSPASDHGLDLPDDESDDPDSRPNRSAAAVGLAAQVPKPVAISGTVWLDNNLDAVRQADESPLADVELALSVRGTNGSYLDTGHRVRTDADGHYEFAKSLGLAPGEYRVTQTQPTGLFSVAAIPGTVDGQAAGVASGVNVISSIEIALGDTEAVDMDFAEAQPSRIGGFVYADDNDNGRRDSGEAGIAGVTVRLVPVDTIGGQPAITATTDASGGYTFTGLAPGRYEIIEVNQPADFIDGRDAAGTVDGLTVGRAVNPGDRIVDIDLDGGVVGAEYNFGELAVGEISGRVYLVAPGQDCDGRFDVDVDQPLGGVIVELRRPDGNVLSRVTTTPMGIYRFDAVPPGSYRIVQYTPDGLLDGRAYVGTIDGVRSGTAAGGSLIEQITMTPGGVGIQYDFCEIAPAGLSGYVYHDQSLDGRRDPQENGIAGVNVSLVDTNGQTVATTTTDADGRYEFAGLTPGTYQLVQQQPAGWIDGDDSAGRIRGATVGTAANDRITDIVLPQGSEGVEYNFGELLPASLSGMVHADTDGDCVWEAGEQRLAGVVIRLLDANGREVAVTQTNADGIYRFRDLAPGTYTLVQEQPDGYFDQSAKPGSAGGVSGVNRIAAIGLGSGVNGVDYDFCEQPPSSLSGRVHADLDGDCILDPGEQVLSGVVMRLYDANGRPVAVTRTDAEGKYRFDGLVAGEYSVVQEQPSGYFDRSAKVGSEGGVAGANRITEIVLHPGIDAVNYDFCEQPPASLSGSVHVDHDGDCVRDPGEPGLGGVTIELRDASGTLVRTTRTDDSGNYRFENLPAGTYTIFEVQPEGFLQGGQVLGSAGGVVLGVDLMSVSLRPGEDAVDYLFCEYQPGSISGYVWSDDNQNQVVDPGESYLSGVSIQLLDENGVVFGTAQTDVAGRYEFDGLPRGVYSVRQSQPSGYFHGGQLIGDRGGSVGGEDWLVGIELGSGTIAENYRFPEIPPAILSGFVFIDGQPIRTPEPIAAEDLRQYRDGVLTSDDRRLSGVVLEVRDAAGNLLNDDAFLDGDAAANSIVQTDENGFYVIRGLRPGVYSIFQQQPSGLIDSLDTAGSTGGLAVNAADRYSDEQLRFIASIAGTEDRDAILLVSVDGGQASTDNNFSEVQIEIVEPQIAFLPQPAAPQERPEQPLPETFDAKRIVFAAAESERLLPPPFLGEVDAVTWHLSIINGGYPRGIVQAGTVFREVAMNTMAPGEADAEHSRGKWKLMTLDGQIKQESAQMVLGADDAIALAGDFDGDGRDEVAIYVAGKWLVDLNGNGVWDAGDLWILLGTEMDRPVIGDWDGDGKDDIGIYGRTWEQDLRRVKLDAGLPDPSNRTRSFLENRKTLGLVSARLRSEDRVRVLRRSDGALRADAVDHVFQYGEDVDTPISGDWNGDGIDQIGIFRAGTWVLDSEGDGRRKPGETQFEFGRPGDRPIVGDFNGDGIDEVGVIRGNQWIIDSDGDRKLTAADRRIDVPAQSASTQPVVGDWDGDGIDEPGQYDQAG
jgi:protocatechuate 3,4-dioxygenase beta subunit